MESQMEKKSMLLKSGLEFFNIYSSPRSDSNKSFVSFSKEGCESPLSSCDSKYESDKCLSLLGEENYCDMKQNRADKEIYKLMTQIEESEAILNIHIPKLKISNLVEQLEITYEKLKISEDENAVLRKEVESKSRETHELQGKLIEAEEHIAESDLELVSGRKHIQILEKLVLIYEQEVQKLKSQMLDSQDKFSLEKDELYFDIANLLKTKIELTSTLADCEFRNNELESKLKQYEGEKLKQEDVHAKKMCMLLKK